MNSNLSINRKDETIEFYNINNVYDHSTIKRFRDEDIIFTITYLKDIMV